MKLLRKRVRNSDKTYAVMFTSQSELEILQATVTKAELHTPKIPDTEKVLNRLKSMRITLSKALGQWDELSIVDEIASSNTTNVIPSSEEIREHLYEQLKAQIAIYSGRKDGGLAVLQNMFCDLNEDKDIVCECCNQKITDKGMHKSNCEIVTNYFNVFNK